VDVVRRRWPSKTAAATVTLGGRGRLSATPLSSEPSPAQRFMLAGPATPPPVLRRAFARCTIGCLGTVHVIGPGTSSDSAPQAATSNRQTRPSRRNNHPTRPTRRAQLRGWTIMRDNRVPIALSQQPHHCLAVRRVERAGRLVGEKHDVRRRARGRLQPAVRSPPDIIFISGSAPLWPSHRALARLEPAHHPSTPWRRTPSAPSNVSEVFHTHREAGEKIEVLEHVSRSSDGPPSPIVARHLRADQESTPSINTDFTGSRRLPPMVTTALADPRGPITANAVPLSPHRQVLL